MEAERLEKWKNKFVILFTGRYRYEKSHKVLIDAVNEYVMKNIFPRKKIHIYELYAYAGALLNSFLKWEEDGKRESAHDVALMIYRLFNHKEEE